MYACEESRLHLVEPTALGDCDAFLSHSWHDDTVAKWAAMTTWCNNFTREHGRGPRLWIDKMCIDQQNIAADLEYLPIALAACVTLLVMAGPTYIERLWCVMELYVFWTMNEGLEQGIGTHIDVVPLGDEEKVWAGWRSFDAAQCKCFAIQDKRKIMAVVGSDLDAFNQEVRAIVDKVRRHRQTRVEEEAAAAEAARQSSRPRRISAVGLISEETGEIELDLDFAAPRGPPAPRNRAAPAHTLGRGPRHATM